MRTASSNLGELLAVAKRSIEGITFSLSALILPVGRPLVRECLWQLNNQGKTRIKMVKDLVGLAVPKDTAMLLARATDAAYVRKRYGHSFSQSVENEVYRLHPHGDGCIDLTCLLVDVNTFLDAIFTAKVLVKIDLGFANDFEV
jgi:hypothetical protein